MIMEIGKYIEDLTGLVPGDTLWIGYLPKVKPGTKLPPPDRITVVLENTPSPGDPDWPDYVQKEIQVLHRAKFYFTARADAEALYADLHGLAGVELPVINSGEAYIANTIHGVGTPASIGPKPDDQGYFTFSTNYIFRITRLD